tara:strand:+ start:768 stop:1055 length:288 start_codon:yes stop_codon:yes gene_type:complete
MKVNEENELQDLVGKVVTVAVSTCGIVRNGFFTQMSIQGELESMGMDSTSDQYRVVKDECSYVYFDASDVYLVNPLVSTGVVIHTRIDTPPEDEL